MLLQVIQINGFYCEHLGNVSKYIETTDIQSMQLKNTSTGLLYNVVNKTILNLITEENNMSLNTLSSAPISQNMDYVPNFSSLLLNGISISNIESKYYISEINQEILARKFPNNSIHIGDEVNTCSFCVF